MGCPTTKHFAKGPKGPGHAGAMVETFNKFQAKFLLYFLLLLLPLSPEHCC